MSHDVFVFGNGGNTAAFGGGKAGAGAGEADDLPQFFFCQGFGGFADLQDLADGTAAEDIAGAGGVDDLDTA